MVSLKNLIVNDANTRTVEGTDLHNAFFSDSSNLTLNKQLDTKQVGVWDKNTDSVDRDHIVFSSEEYKAYLRQCFSDFNSIINQTYISPKNTKQIIDQYSDHFHWHKHKSSGRNFCKSIVNENAFGMDTVIVKGGDMLTGDQLNNIEYSYAYPIYGGATINELEQEFKVSQYVQNVALKIFGRPTYLPQPIKLSKLDKYIYPGDDSIVDYRNFVQYLIHTDKNHRTNMCSLDMELGRGHFLNNKEKKVYSFVDSDTSDLMYDYWDKLGDHGSYLYMIQGTNMRITDVLSFPNKDMMKKVIKQHYPKDWSDEQILEAFMNRFAEVHGLMLGLGFRFKPGRISGCFPGDTTIQGLKMDVGTYTMQGDIINEEFIKQQIPYMEICFLMYTIFNKPNIEQFQEMFDAWFSKRFSDSFVDGSTKDNISIHKSKDLLYNGWKKSLLPELIKGLKLSQENPKQRVASMRHIKKYLMIIND